MPEKGVNVRRLLMIAYFFPPVGGVGIERTLKHVTYLGEHGWQPVVVSVSNSGYRIVDPSTAARIPVGVEIHRSATVEPAHLRAGIAAALRAVGLAPSRSAGTEAVGPPSEPGGRHRQGVMGRLRDAANATWGAAIPLIFFPDDQLLWTPGAIRAAERAHQQLAVDAVYSSSPPISGHLAAGIVARRIGRPWVADFRDPWIDNAFARPLPALHRAARRRLERWIVERADRVVLSTDRMRARFAERYPERADRLVHMPNGYDLGDLAVQRINRPADGSFQLIYAGSLYAESELDLFLDGVELLLAHQPEARNRLRVEFVGWFSDTNRAIAERRFPSLDPVVRQVGFVPRRQAIAMERSADAGLVIISGNGNRGLVATSKLYEYIGLDLPVLAIVPPGEVRDILDRLTWGVAVDPTAAGVSAGLAAIMDAPRPDRHADPNRLYERRSLTARLAELLETLVDPSHKSESVIGAEQQTGASRGGGR